MPPVDPNPTIAVVNYRMDQMESRVGGMETNLKRNTEATEQIASYLREGQIKRDRRIKRYRWLAGVGFSILAATQPYVYKLIDKVL